MANKSLNLIYSTNQFQFFSQVKQTKDTVLTFKKEGVINDFGGKDNDEAGRGKSYAVFPELHELVDSGSQITIKDIKDGLIQRGVADEVLQNKILVLLLQGKAGLQFAMGNVLNSLLLGHEPPFSFLMDRNYDVSLDVKDKDHVKLILKANWLDLTQDPPEAGLAVQVAIDITPTKVVIDKFEITQVAQTERTKDAFAFLQANQANIFQKIIIFLKTYFNSNSSIEIENERSDKVSWKENTKKIIEESSPELENEPDAGEEPDDSNKNQGCPI